MTIAGACLPNRTCPRFSAVFRRVVGHFCGTLFEDVRQVGELVVTPCKVRSCVNACGHVGGFVTQLVLSVPHMHNPLLGRKALLA